MDQAAKEELIQLLHGWRDLDEPLVEAVGDALDKWAKLDSQETARRVVDVVIEVLSAEL